MTAALIAVAILVIMLGFVERDAVFSHRADSTNEHPPAAQSVGVAGPSALDDPTAAGLPAPLVDPARIISGGPPPDGIPPIDDPKFQRAADVDWLGDSEAVVTLHVGDETRAYPIAILTWHEIVNDTIGGTPVAVTYCPLCNTAIAFNRSVDDRVLTFGTSGKLYLSNLVMYDRQTESLWPQIEGRAAAGTMTGRTLAMLPVNIEPWQQWRQANPDSMVLSRDTGHPRDYGRNPYIGYDEPTSQPFALDTNADPRLPAKERIVAFPASRQAIAVTLARLADDRAVNISVDDQPVALFAAPGLASSLDAASIADGKPITATRAYLATVDGQALTFHPEGRAFLDTETNSRWDIDGRAASGPLRGNQLTPITHIDTFWFAWAAFRPDTTVLPEQ